MSGIAKALKDKNLLPKKNNTKECNGILPDYILNNLNLTGGLNITNTTIATKVARMMCDEQNKQKAAFVTPMLIFMSPLIVMIIIFSVLFCKEKLLAYLDRRKENYKKIGLLACTNDFIH